MSLGSPDFYKAIVGVANKKSLRTPELSHYIYYIVFRLFEIRLQIANAF